MEHNRRLDDERTLFIFVNHTLFIAVKENNLLLNGVHTLLFS
jgi:hypothetical protein